MSNRAYIRYISILTVFLLFLIDTALGSVEYKASLSVVLQNGKLIIHAENIELGKLLEEIDRKCSIDIIGLNSRKNEIITFLSEGDIQAVLKRLFSYLGEPNYAFEFTGIKISRAAVLPAGVSRPVPPPMQKTEEPASTDIVSVVRVQKTLEGSQAEALGLKEGDLVIEYDGEKITSSQQLVNEVNKKTGKARVDILVVRDHVPMRFDLNGGKIGIYIQTVRIPKGEYDQYF